MKELFRQARIDLMTSSVLCILFGVVLIWKPNETVDFFSQIFAIGLMVIGLLFAGSYLLKFMTNGLSLAAGITVAVLGLVLWFNPQVVQIMIPAIIGVVLLIHGVEEIRMAMASKQYGYESWTGQLISAIFTLVLAVVCVVNAFTVVKYAMIILGLSLIYSGISNLLVTSRATKVEREYKKTHKDETIEGTFKEDQTKEEE